MQIKRFVIFAIVLITPAFVPGLLGQDDLIARAKQPRYRLVDLGTFGSQASLVFGGTGAPWCLNAWTAVHFPIG
jgi:hypothetical protein